ncbi:MAG: molybdenum cofactor guanylyltransferase [Vicinamibacterales bacterium]
MWTAAILAGGEARRLGGLDKSGLAVGTGKNPRSMLDRQLAVLRDLTPHILIVDGASDRHQSRQWPADVRVIHDRIPGAGALGGLYTALMEATTEQVLVIACDMPFLTKPFVAHLAALGAESNGPARADVVLPRDQHGRHPLCASYHRRSAPVLKAGIDAGNLRVLDAITRLVVREIGPDDLALFDRDGQLLMNVNTPADYERALQS